MLKGSASIHERELQKKVHAKLLSGTTIIRGISGNLIHVLNPGRLNPYPGPDFMDMAIMMNGELIIGKGEFHKNSSDWYAHNHHLDSRYADVILHIVCKHDVDIHSVKETILIPLDVILSIKSQKSIIALTNLDDLQDYAFCRLMRRCSEIESLLSALTVEHAAVSTYCIVFLQKRMHQRRRNIKNQDDIHDIIHIFLQSPCINAIMDHHIDLPDIRILSSHSRNGLHNHLFGELFLNAFFPFLLASEVSRRESLIEWYWNQKSVTEYHSLNRRFPDIPQQYIWQQQGILEYLRNEYAGGKSCGESLYSYLDIYENVQ
jgi:hypothetical protein